MAACFPPCSLFLHPFHRRALFFLPFLSLNDHCLRPAAKAGALLSSFGACVKLPPPSSHPSSRVLPQNAPTLLKTLSAAPRAALRSTTREGRLRARSPGLGAAPFFHCSGRTPSLLCPLSCKTKTPTLSIYKKTAQKTAAISLSITLISAAAFIHIIGERLKSVSPRRRPSCWRARARGPAGASAPRARARGARGPCPCAPCRPASRGA